MTSGISFSSANSNRNQSATGQEDANMPNTHLGWYCPFLQVFAWADSVQSLIWEASDVRTVKSLQGCSNTVPMKCSLLDLIQICRMILWQWEMKCGGQESTGDNPDGITHCHCRLRKVLLPRSFLAAVLISDPHFLRDPIRFTFNAALFNIPSSSLFLLDHCCSLAFKSFL